ncbi:MAG: Rieske (2Fe-2S) protein [Candidatus Schekmanbacteria bacterium]|nr:MAG: Rieske (2Fe-2S) protein [Candidatus Schekmanbacteria bacterium]
MEKNESIFGRRTFIDYIIGFVVSAWAFLTAYVTLAYLWPSKKSIGAGGKSVTIPLSDVPEGKARKIRYEGKPAIIIRTSEGVFALSAVCTHLGCLVNWHEGDQLIECPCHAAKFDIRGNVIGGPAPKPLQSYRAEIKGDIIKIG